MPRSKAHDAGRTLAAAGRLGRRPAAPRYRTGAPHRPQAATAQRALAASAAAHPRLAAPARRPLAAGAPAGDFGQRRFATAGRSRRLAGRTIARTPFQQQLPHRPSQSGQPYPPPHRVCARSNPRPRPPGAQLAEPHRRMLNVQRRLVFFPPPGRTRRPHACRRAGLLPRVARFGCARAD